MADHLTEEEQIEAIKQWWKDNWLFVVVPIVLAGALYSGWGVWQQKKADKSESGSVIYEQLVKSLETAPGEALTAEKRSQAESLATEIAAGYEGTLYGDNSNLILARLAVEKNELTAAEGYLQRVVQNGSNASIMELAKARLARVKIAQAKYDEALELVSSAAGADDYKAMFAEIRGDALAGLGNSVAAKTAYEEAVESLPQRQFSRQSILRMKIDGVDILAGTIKVSSSESEEPAADAAAPEGDDASTEAQEATTEGNS